MLLTNHNPVAAVIHMRRANLSSFRLFRTGLAGCHGNRPSCRRHFPAMNDTFNPWSLTNIGHALTICSIPVPPNIVQIRINHRASKALVHRTVQSATDVIRPHDEANAGDQSRASIPAINQGANQCS
jgi:hypothetical protein